MIQSADRLKNVSEYYFSEKLKEVAQMNAEGKQVINLGIGSPDLPPSEETINEMCEQSKHAHSHGYQSYAGIPELRKGFAGWYKKWYDIDLNPANEILPLIGSKEGILHISLAFLNPGDEVLVPDPGYPTYSSLSKLLGAKVRYYDLKEENNWYPDFDALDKTDLTRVKLMWVNYPNMPTGTPATMELFQRLVDFGKKHQIVICHDNPYSFILNDKPLSILGVPGAKDICIELNSMSKSHNMPGWRVGMAASNEQFIRWALQVKSNIDSGMFRPLQLAAAKALENDKAWHDDMNAIYRKRRKIAEDIMRTLHCSFDEKQAGLFLWGKIPAEIENCKALADKLLYESHVFITPGFIFGSNGERYIRISLCANEEMLLEALKRMISN